MLTHASFFRINLDSIRLKRTSSDFIGITPSEIAGLYRALSGRLERIVRSEINAPDAVIEDACQFAWSRLLHRAADVRRDRVLSWLAKTAINEAFKLSRRERRELSLERTVELAEEHVHRGRAPGPEELVFTRERLNSLQALPERQQRLLWLRALGLSYEEMALHTGCTERTVERQLLRARHAVRADAAA